MVPQTEIFFTHLPKSHRRPRATPKTPSYGLEKNELDSFTNGLHDLDPKLITYPLKGRIKIKAAGLINCLTMGQRHKHSTCEIK